MPHIVAAIDPSSRSRHALRRAGLLATEIGADLTFISVVDDGQAQDIVESARHEADHFLNEQMASLAELRGVSCHAMTVVGNPVDAIVKVAEDVACDLIVMGAGSERTLRDAFVGTTVERVIRSGAFPVLMVNTEADKPYARIVAAVDLSPASARAVKTAQALHLTDRADVSLLHAFDAPNEEKMNLADAPKIEIDAYVRNVRERAAAELSAFRAEHGLDDEAWRPRREEGGAFAVLARVASKEQPDLVVIGTLGRSALVRALLGSVAEEALRRLDEVDILAVPPAR